MCVTLCLGRSNITAELYKILCWNEGNIKILPGKVAFSYPLICRLLQQRLLVLYSAKDYNLYLKCVI